MAGWTNLTPSAGALASGSAYLHEDAGALKYQGTSGSIATLVNADGTLPSSGSTSYNPQNNEWIVYGMVVGTNTTPTINRMYLMPADGLNGLTLNSIGIYNTTGVANSTVRLGLYSDLNGLPDTLILDAGTVATTSVGAKNITITSTAITASKIWVAVCAQTAAAPLLTGSAAAYGPGYVSRSSGVPGGFYPVATLDSVSGAFPSTLTRSTLGGVNPPFAFAVRSVS